MKILKINNLQYEIVDSKEKITIADSFVLPANKIGGGNGEAKLYIGHDDESQRKLLGSRGFLLDCFMLKEDLIQYLNETRVEYNSPTQDYRQKENLPELWELRKNKVNQLDSIIPFQLKDQNQIAGPRVYVNSNDEGYKLIRELSLPVISHLNIFKLKETGTNNIKFYLELYSDYHDTIPEEEETSVQSEEFEPFDPMKISIDTKNISMDTVLRRLVQGTINLNPDFQRNEVWTPEKKCQLIESLMLKIPLPMFYVSIDENSHFNVVDGLQRLSTIRDFVLGQNYLKSKDESEKGNGMTLQKLEFWGNNFDGLQFNDLPVNIRNRILETEFTFTIINPGTPEDVKRNIFKRVNRGGEPLTDQEIRHALYVGNSTILLKELSKNDSFLNATDDTIKSNRMLDREFILRSLAFIIRNYTTYPKNGNMDGFLSDTMRIINLMPDFENQDAKIFFKNGIDKNDIQIKSIDQLKNVFLIAMNRSETIFGEHTFRKSYLNNRKTPINKALFEVWGSLLSTLTETEFSTLENNKSFFMKEYIETYLSSDNFNEIVSRNALKQSSVFERHNKLKELLKKFTHD
jgi:hypothetical protein